MELSNKFVLLFCLTCVLCSVIEALNNTENSTSESLDINCDDFCRLRYHANDTVLTLKPGEYEIRPDGTLFIDLNNSTLNKTLFEVWSNDSLGNVTDCKIQYESWQFLLASHLVSLIALHMCLTVVVTITDPVKLVESTSQYVFVLLLFCIFLLFVNLSKCPQTCLAVRGLLHYISLTLIFWKSSAVFDSFINQVTYRHVWPGGPHEDIRMINQNVVTNFTVRMLAVASIASILHALKFPYVEAIGEGAAECGVPQATMYSTFTRSVIAYAVVGALNFLIYRRFLTDREVPGELLRILKDLCDLNFMFFAILTFTWFFGCHIPAGNFVFYANTAELSVLFLLLLNFLRYCNNINWQGAFLYM